MIPWELLARAKASDSEELTLHRRGTEYCIKVDGSLLMDSTAHASEAALADIACKDLGRTAHASVLIGGLGMGFTLAAALKKLRPDAEVSVAELVPAVVDWNRGVISHLAGHPLKDKRVAVLAGDVAAVLRRERGAFDAILQDVDNGPEGLTLKANDWLYSEEGLAAAGAALKPGGLLAFWAAKPDKGFVKRMRKTGFAVDEIPVRSRNTHRGAHYVVWLAKLNP
ncbi:MAG: hypothetical protein WC943_02185 [Elusimicrobiota bacterium]|jgi:spermidine synthase